MVSDSSLTRARVVSDTGRTQVSAGGRTDARHWRTAAVSVTGCLALCAAFGATVLVPLV